jgi:4-amino-4-deoxy-L-arabinose transferase-like glycosyltransferase
MTPVLLGQASALPRSLISCFPWLWSQILFPGRLTASTKPRLWSAFLLIVLPGLLLYPRSSFLLLEPDESRYAQIPREMLQRGDWIVPHLQSQPYLDKPPLLYWLVMFSYKLFGVNEASARLVPALAMHGTILLTYFWGRRFVGERAAFWGALLLSVAPGFMSIGRLLIIDGLLAFLTNLALFSTFEAVRGDRFRRNWWLLGAVAAGLAVLTKGPVVLALLVPPVWLYRRMQTPTATIGWKRLAEFLAIMATVNAPWYMGMALRKPAFVKYFFWDQNVIRFVQPFDHIRPVWFYVPVLLIGLVPATFLVIGFCRYLFTGNPYRTQTRSPELGFLLLAGFWCVLFFSISGSKLPTYILPAFPSLALAIGAYVANRWPISPRVPAALAGGGFVLLLFIHQIAVPWYAHERSPMAEPERLVKYCPPEQAVICFPRTCDSVSFYLDRSDLKTTRSKNSQELVDMLYERRRTVVLFTHRHSLDALKYVLPRDLKIAEVISFRRKNDLGELFDVLSGETPWGLCDLVVVENLKNK